MSDTKLLPLYIIMCPCQQVRSNVYVLALSTGLHPTESRLPTQYKTVHNYKSLSHQANHAHLTAIVWAWSQTAARSMNLKGRAGR